MAELVLLLVAIAIATIGATGYAIFGPLTVRHLADRDQAEVMDGSSLSFIGIRWLLAARWRLLDDPGLHLLALPATIMLWLIVLGLVLLGISNLIG